MSRRVALVVLLCLGAAPAAGDETIARRIAALKAIVEPASARPARPDAAPPGSRCTEGAWWRITEYGVTSRIEAAVHDAAVRFGVAPALIRSVIRHESNYDSFAVSHKGAMGIMQLMPATARALRVVCAFDPRENILGGVRYLRRLKDRLGTWPRALAGYHAGPGSVEAGRIPEETRRYVRRVVATWKPRHVASMFLD